MRLFLDCEYNDFQGALISMALVAEDGREWYEVLPCPNPSEWISVNVMPILFKAPLTNKLEFTTELVRFLKYYESVHIVADWPEDIAHFCNALIIGAGERYYTPPLTMEILRIDSVSKIPHNALEDARGIRDAVMAFE